MIVRLTRLIPMGIGVIAFAVMPAWGQVPTGPVYMSRGAAPVVVPTSRVVDPTGRAFAPAPSPYPGFGTFVPTPTVMIQSNGIGGNGISGLGQYGQTGNRIEYGPTSRFVQRTDTVRFFSRGYDGVVRQTGEGERGVQPYLTPDNPEVIPAARIVAPNGRAVPLDVPRRRSLLEVRNQY